MQHNKPRGIYIGIDLGTTNSAIAYGGISRVSNRCDAQIIKIQRKVDAYGSGDESLLPSCKYFPERGTPFVGNYAKTMLGKYPNRVAKSMKCYMDQGNCNFGTADVPWTPIEVSTSILRHLKSGASNRFNALENFPEVVIAVPASFPSIMRKATIEAARSAGFEITNQNLLEESTAALHYFCNRKQLPGEDIEFNESKILVFDLGGGTLDVSLHEVTKNGNGLTINDIAESPYKKFGGDQFDEKVADVLLSEYVSTHGNPTKTSNEWDQLKHQFQFYAEFAKIQLGYQINEPRHIPNPHYEINEQPCLLTGRSLPRFNYDLTWDEYKNVIEPFLHETLRLNDPHCPSRSDNIIDPILKVLDDAKTDECPDRPKVDIVLLNGGMTKLPVVEKRLKKFFGEGVIVYNDSDKADKAVALGAVYHQASL